MSYNVEKKRIATRAFRERNPGYMRSWHLHRHYGITQEAYDMMLEKQNGGCAVCGRNPEKKPLHVDHDHRTGKVRGLLCGACNRALGLLSESTERIEALLRYLKGANCAG